jgi:type IV pilus assembly protein PilE
MSKRVTFSGQVQAGFTLLELMIVVAIVGLLTVVGYPSYQGFIKDSNRSAVQADLMSFAAALERHKAASFSYLGAAEAGENTGKPAIFHGHSPSAEPYANRRYDLTISEASNSTYVLQAKPITGSVQQDDGSVFLFGDGRRAWDVNNDGSLSASEFCWRC